MDGVNCDPKKYEGYFFEIPTPFAAGVGDLDIGMETDPKTKGPTFNGKKEIGVNDTGITAGLQIRIFNVCVYEHVGTSDLGCCGG